MPVFVTEKDDYAKMTFATKSADYQFEIWQDGDYAYVEYQETQTWRGSIKVVEPHETVYNKFMRSEAVTDFLDKHGLDGVRKADKEYKYSR
jgi:hypothetical protein